MEPRDQHTAASRFAAEASMPNVGGLHQLSKTTSRARANSRLCNIDRLPSGCSVIASRRPSAPQSGAAVWRPWRTSADLFQPWNKFHRFISRQRSPVFGYFVANTRSGAYMQLITDSGSKPGVGGCEFGNAPACNRRQRMPPAITPNLTSIVPIFRSAGFDAEATQNLGKAYDIACGLLHPKARPPRRTMASWRAPPG
jgi:hypothetical protein